MAAWYRRLPPGWAPHGFPLASPRPLLSSGPMAADPLLLTERQRRLVGFALTLLAVLATVALLAGSIWVLGRLVGRFSGVLWPLAVAGILALILRPAVDFFEARLRLRRLAAVFLLYVLFFSLVTGL